MLIAIPPGALRLLLEIPRGFVDDGCTAAPDLLFGVDLAWACRIHDWCACTRAHPEGFLTLEWKLLGDQMLRGYVRESLRGHPLRFLIAATFFAGVRLFGGSFNTCGPEAGERCRHGLARPAWMKGGN